MASNVVSLVHRPETSLVTLEQSVAPSVVPPKALNGYMKGIASSILQTVMEDFSTEAKRLKTGKPIPKHQLKKLEKAKKLKKSDLPEIVRKVGSLSIVLASLDSYQHNQPFAFKLWNPSQLITFHDCES